MSLAILPIMLNPDATRLPMFQLSALQWLKLALVFALPVCSAFALDPVEHRGRELAQQIYDRPDGADVTVRGTMVLTEAGREPRVRQMYSYRRDAGDGSVGTMIRFTAPSDIAGTGLLTLDYPDGASDQWVYLPALGSSRRIPATRRGGRFVGSDLFYEDIQDRKVDLDRHHWLGTEELDGIATEKLESVPTDPTTSVYGRRISWIHPEVLIPLRVDYFRPDSSEPYKRLSVYRIEQIDGYWTVMDSLMQDLDSGHQTRLINEIVHHDRELPDALFTTRALADPGLEQPYRP